MEDVLERPPSLLRYFVFAQQHHVVRLPVLALRSWRCENLKTAQRSECLWGGNVFFHLNVSCCRESLSLGALGETNALVSLALPPPSLSCISPPPPHSLSDVVERAPVQGHQAVPPKGSCGVGQRASAQGRGHRAAGHHALPLGWGKVSAGHHSFFLGWGEVSQSRPRLKAPVRVPVRVLVVMSIPVFVAQS